MLHIVNQYKKLFSNLLFTSLKWEEISAWLESDNKKDYLKNNKDAIIAYLKSLDTETIWIAWITNWKIEESELDWHQDKKAFEKILKEVWLDKYSLSRWVDIKEVISAIDSYVLEKKAINADTSGQTWVIKQETLKTVESTDTSMEIHFGSWKTDFAWLRENINYSSYEEIVKTLSYDKLKEFIFSINSIAKKNNLDSKWGYYFTPFNIGDLKTEFTKIWYKADGAFGGIEMGSLFELFENVYKTQEKLNSSSKFTDKLGVIFDYNQDGLLDNDVHFYTKEKQFFDAVKTENQFENLLKNLWYNSKEQFFKWFSNNYFWSRSEFIERLGTVLSTKEVLNPSEMMKSPTALKDFSEAKAKAEIELEKSLNTNPKTKDLPKETKDLIKLEAVWLIVWSSFWAWASFDIKWLTNNIIDSLQIGIINWIPWIWIVKNIYKSEKWRFKVDIWAVNFIPMISASWVIKEAEYDKFKKLFPKEIDSKTQVTLTWALSPVWSAVMLDFSKADEKTKLGIEKAKDKISWTLDKVFEEIKSGKTFEESSFKEEASNKIIYERLNDLYKANWDTYVKTLKEGTLKNYERALYQNAEWLNYAWFWVWLLFIAGYLPVPLVLVHWDYNQTEWKRKLTAWEKPKSEKSWDNSESNWSSVTTRENIKSKYETWNLSIDKKLSSFESAFSFRTRYNKWALAFMSPEGSLESRWNWLLQLSKWVKALKDVKLNQFLTWVKTENEKWLVISTISQYMKKANDFDNWNIKSWNKNVDSYITKDKSRRRAFNNMMGPDLSIEAQKYYESLKAWKWQIWESKIKWVWFDATSSINVEGSKKAVKWMDTLYTNLSILTVNWKPLLIPITDKSKIEAFKEKVRNAKNVSEDVKASLISWIDKWNIELNFYKDPEGFDDRILPIIKKTITWWIEEAKTNSSDSDIIEVFQPEHSTVKVWIWYVWDKKPDWWNWNNWDGLTSEPGEIREPAPVNQNWIWANWQNWWTTVTWGFWS